MAAKVKTATKKRPAQRKSAASKSKKRSAAHNSHPRATHVASHKSAEQPLMKTLRAEHRHMSTIMNLFSDQLRAIETGELVDTNVVYEIMDYMISWPDRYHHPREDLIYARVAEISGKDADDVDTLQRDHDYTAKSGRELLKDVVRWREGAMDGAALVKKGRVYVDHLNEHMNIEEKLVFPHIESTLSLADWRELSAYDQLEAVSPSIFSTGVQREYRNMTRKLRRNLRRSVERGAMTEWMGMEALMESLEVVSIAFESARDTTGGHVRTAWEESLEIIREAPLSAPLRCAANNLKVTYHLLGEVADISRETVEDLNRVGQAHRDRVRLLARNFPPR